MKANKYVRCNKQGGGFIPPSIRKRHSRYTIPSYVDYILANSQDFKDDSIIRAINQREGFQNSGKSNTKPRTEDQDRDLVNRAYNNFENFSADDWQRYRPNRTNIAREEVDGSYSAATPLFEGNQIPTVSPRAEKLTNQFAAGAGRFVNDVALEGLEMGPAAASTLIDGLRGRGFKPERVLPGIFRDEWFPGNTQASIPEALTSKEWVDEHPYLSMGIDMFAAPTAMAGLSKIGKLSKAAASGLKGLSGIRNLKPKAKVKMGDDIDMSTSKKTRAEEDLEMEEYMKGLKARTEKVEEQRLAKFRGEVQEVMSTPDGQRFKPEAGEFISNPENPRLNSQALQIEKLRQHNIKTTQDPRNQARMRNSLEETALSYEDNAIDYNGILKQKHQREIDARGYPETAEELANLNKALDEAPVRGSAKMNAFLDDEMAHIQKSMPDNQMYLTYDNPHKKSVRGAAYSYVSPVDGKVPNPEAAIYGGTNGTLTNNMVAHEWRHLLTQTPVKNRTRRGYKTHLANGRELLRNKLKPFWKKRTGDLDVSDPKFNAEKSANLDYLQNSRDEPYAWWKGIKEEAETNRIIKDAQADITPEEFKDILDWNDSYYGGQSPDDYLKSIGDIPGFLKEMNKYGYLGAGAVGTAGLAAKENQ